MDDRDSSVPEDGIGACRILVIDDEEVVHASLRRILGRRGHVVDTELTAAGALCRLAERAYDLVITDLMMPETNGIELLERMKAMGLFVPTIMITGYPTIKTALQALRLGATDYLAKPFTRKELFAPVSRALRRSRSQSAASIRDTAAPLGNGFEEPAVRLEPGDRVHLRRHSWAVYRDDGTMDVGIGASFLSVVGAITAVELPSDADLLEQGYVGIRLTTERGEVHGVFMPLSGRVVATNLAACALPSSIGPTTWLVRLIPDRLEAELPLLVGG